MLDRHLPAYLMEPQTIDGESYDLAAMVGDRIYRTRPPQAAAMPYIWVGDGQGIDHGQTSGPDLTHEVGHYAVYLIGDPAEGYYSLDPIVDVLVAYLKACRQRYIPTALADPKMWVQCILLQDRHSLDSRPIDGDEAPLIGYCIPIRAGYGKSA